MAGEHKCPLCPATFTRPQHVGRHLRAHTGDRPYEWKECPLRFARSDLLSRHVNKAHRTPEPGESKKDGKKGRRKSMPSSARRPDGIKQASEEKNLGPLTSAPAAPGDPQPQPPAQEQESAQAKERARRASFDQAQPPQLQAQRMYPNHPLLAGTPPPMAWKQTPGVNGLVRSPVNTFNGAMLGTPTSTAGFHPGIASPLWPGMDLSAGSSAMTRNESGYTTSSFDYGVKKRACDQCNHSKVRCDFAHPCTRCSHRNVHCTYNKPPKSRTLPITPGLSYPMTAMPTGTSLSPVSHFSSPPHSTGSPLTQTSFQSQQLPGQLLNSASPTRGWVSGLPPQSSTPAPPLSQFADNGFDNAGINQVLPNLSAGGQALGMYMLPPPPQQSSAVPGPAAPITQQHLGQLAHVHSSSASPPQALLPTPSLTSHTTSPSSSDEPPERKSSLIGNIAALPLPPPGKANSVFRDQSDPTSTGVFPPTAVDGLPQPVTVNQTPTTAGSLYHWPTSAFTMDPRYQFRNPAITAQSDDEGDGNQPSSSASVFNDTDDPVADVQRRRSSVGTGIWATAFNSMSLQDGALPPNLATVPDPYTAVQVAQRAIQPRPMFPMATMSGANEPAKMPSLSDVKDVWKLFMQDPQGGAGVTPKQEKREGDGGMAMITPRPGMDRTLSKSNSMPDLKSPPLGNSQYDLSSGTHQGQSAPEGPQGQQPGATDAGQTQQSSEDATRQTWHNQIQQRQATFTMQPGARFGRNSNPDPTPSSSANNAMLPPSFHQGRPVASIIQHSGALQQTLAPERAPSFGLTPNTEKPNPTNLTPPQTASVGTWSRTPSKLSQRTAMATSANARPGTKRLPSQTLVPEAKKRSASFSIWDEGDDGALGDTEDDDGKGLYNFSAASYGLPGSAGGGSHSRSASMGSNQTAAFDLSMFINQQMPLSAGNNYAVPPSMGPPTSGWSTTTAGVSDNKAI